MPTMMQSSAFSDFNPLDVLAAAASLQSARTTDSDSETTETGGRDDGSQEEDTGDQDGDEGLVKNDGDTNEETRAPAVTSGSNMTVIGPPAVEEGLMRPPLDKTGPRSAQGRKKTVDGNTILTMRDATKIMMPSPSNKALTVLRINKQMTDHSYAYVCQVQNLRSEEDEGYSSRSSIDEEGDDITRSLSAPHTPGSLASDLGSPRGSDLGSPGLAFESLHSPTSPKPSLDPKRTKIVILSSDNVHKSSAPAESKTPACQPGSVVLRTLLGQKPIASLASKLGQTSGMGVECSASAAYSDSPLSIQVGAAPRPTSPPLIDLVADTSVNSEAEHMATDHLIPAQEHTDSSCMNDLPPGEVSEQGSSCEPAPNLSTLAEEASMAPGAASPNCDNEHCHEAIAELATPPTPLPALTSASCTQTHTAQDTSTAQAAVTSEEHGESPEHPHDQHVTSCSHDTNHTDRTISNEMPQATGLEASSVDVSCDTAPEQDQTYYNNDIDINEPCTSELRHKDSPDTQPVKLETEIKIPIVQETVENPLLSEKVTNNETQSTDSESLTSSEAADRKAGDHGLEEESAPTEPSAQDEESMEVDVVSTGTETLSSAPVDITSPLSLGGTDATPVTTESVRSVAADAPSPGSNQYIIQDDVSPVTKFSEAPPVIVTSAGPVTAAVTLSSTVVSQQSLLKGAASGGFVHVIPVVNASNGRMVTQLLPRSVQYVTAVPIPGKGVVRVADSKLPMGTLMVPATFTPAVSAQPSLPKSRAGGSKSRLTNSAVSQVLASGLLLPSINITASPEKVARSGSVDKAETAMLEELTGLSSPGCNDPMLGSPASLPGETVTLGGSRPATPASSTWLGTSESATRPGTPASSTRPGTPAGDKINLQISASLIMEGSSPVDEYASARKETRSIGTLGSLSWRGVNPGLIQLGSKDNKAEFLRIQGSNIQTSVASDLVKSGTASLVSLRDPRLDSPGSSLLSPSGSRSVSPWTRAPSDVPSSPEDVILEVSESASEDSNLSTLSSAMGRGYRRRLGALKKLAVSSTTELHPLIDHDYCMFTEFNAQIQSSIIATTETKVKTERKYTKKAKIPPVKPVPPPAPARVGKVKPGKLLKGRRGRYKKKDALRIAEMKKAAAASAAESGPEPDSKLVKKETRRPGRPEKKSTQRKKALGKDQKNYVKIPGSYQDEFVYFATRNYRNRPRKPLEPPPDPNAKPGKIPTVQGLNVFDWYRDMSKTDKSCFGAGDQKSEVSGAEAPSTASSTATVVPGPDATPCHESEVADLVCELSAMIPAGAAATGQKKEGGKEEELDINTMAEQVRMMLNSLGEDELQMLESLEDGSKIAANAALNDTSFDGFLAGFNAGTEEPTLTQNTALQLSCDLDEINDSDLLTTNPSDMSDLLGDLTVSRTQAAVNPSPATAAAPGTEGFVQPPISNMKLDKTELFPEIVAPPTIPAISQDTAAPELTFVNMYWNDLPGLMIRGKEHVRLVDIHKQVLPAKDTGILKKRCQMMGLEISNCSELQRDFLVRYANAAKSKSTVIVAKAAAQTLIGFYVDPRPRAPRQTAEERAGSARQAELLRKANETPAEKPTEAPTAAAEQAPVPTVVIAEELVEETLESPAVPVEPAVQVAEAGDDVASRSREAHGETTLLPTTIESEVVAATEEAPCQHEPEARGGKVKRKRKRTSDAMGVVDKEYSPDNSRHVLRVDSSHLVKRSERLKHKKVKYADMVNGLPYAEEEQEQEVEADVVEEHAVVAVPVTAAELSHIEVAELEEVGFSSDHENKDWNSQYAEELRKLRAKGKRRKLNKREMGRARRLRDYIHQKEALRKLREKRKVLASRHKLNGQKSRQKLLETHVYTKSMNPEHCYAACPEGFNKESSRHHNADASPTTGDAAPETRGSLLQPLAVLHRDPSHRGGQRSRTQEGTLHLQRLSTRDSHCIQCTTCQENFSVRRFLKHMHHQNNPDELLHVTLAKTLDLSNPSPTTAEQQLWKEFLRKQAALLEAAPVRKDSRRDRAKELHSVSANQQKQPLARDSSKDTGKDTYTKSHKTLDTGSEELHKSLEIKPKTVAAPKEESFVKVAHSSKPLDVEIQICERGEGTSMVDSASTGNSVRQSGRVRKRKQLHPIESYVFSQLSPGNSPASKRVRTDSTIENISVAVSPVRAVKVKVTVKKGEQNTVTKH